ncbi:MAG: TOBE domain-containing protein [Coriobacteriales bacterium]|jgi:molybdopterin-binding protein|nr:TOBE domain-containing protein [Coriobacteriales bacterium]
MKISARNQLKGVITDIQTGAVNSIVAIQVGDYSIKSSITNEAVADLGLKVGEQAYAIVKASNVMVGVDH